MPMHQQGHETLAPATITAYNNILRHSATFLSNDLACAGLVEPR